MTKDKTPPKNEQSKRFVDAARELGTDDDAERFKERLKKLVKAPVGKPAAKTKPKKV
jgi:hypothetical protein